MIARLIKKARSSLILHEIEQISNQCVGKELPPRFIVQECFNWSNADTWCVTCITGLVKMEERTGHFDARKMAAFQLNTKKCEKHKM